MPEGDTIARCRGHQRWPAARPLDQRGRPRCARLDDARRRGSAADRRSRGGLHRTAPLVAATSASSGRLVRATAWRAAHRRAGRGCAPPRQPAVDAWQPLPRAERRASSAIEASPVVTVVSRDLPGPVFLRASEDAPDGDRLAPRPAVVLLAGWRWPALGSRPVDAAIAGPGRRRQRASRPPALARVMLGTCAPDRPCSSTAWSERRVAAFGFRAWCETADPAVLRAEACDPGTHEQAAGDGCRRMRPLR